MLLQSLKGFNNYFTLIEIPKVILKAFLIRRNHSIKKNIINFGNDD